MPEQLELDGEAFVHKLTVVYSELTGIPILELRDYIVTSKGGRKYDRWWLAAKSAIVTAPPFALQLIVESNNPAKKKGNDGMFNWSHAEIMEFYAWAHQLPGWNDEDAPVTYIEVWQGE